MKIKRYGFIFLLITPLVAWAGPRLFRHVLPGITDITPKNGELAVDYSNQTLVYRWNGVTRDLRGTMPSDFVNELPEIEQTTQTILFKTAGQSLLLSDGRVYQFDQNIAVDRIQYSYGLMGVPVLNAGWVYVFAVPDPAAGPDKAKLHFQMSAAAEISEAYRYLGAFYLIPNPNCPTNARLLEGECSLAPTLPPNCHATDISGCPQNYGRLQGIALTRQSNHYTYRIPPKWVYVSPGPGGMGETDRIDNLPAHVVRAWFRTPSSGTTFTAGQTPQAAATMPTVYALGLAILQAPVLVADSSLGFKTTTFIIGHDEDPALHQ